MKEISRERSVSSLALLFGACVMAVLLAMVALGVKAAPAYADVTAGSADLTTQSDDSTEMYRLYNPNTGEHLYTASTAERDKLVPLGWKYEGIGWTAPTKSDTPVYRLFNPNGDDHHYTTSKKEVDSLTPLGWKDEGVAWYSDDDKGVAIYRQFNPNAKTATHNYTESIIENDQLESTGWKAEGTGWYGVNIYTKGPEIIDLTPYDITIPVMYGSNCDYSVTHGDPKATAKGTAYTTQVAIGGKVGGSAPINFTVTCLTKEQLPPTTTKNYALGTPSNMKGWNVYITVPKNSTWNPAAFKSLVVLA